MASPSKRLKRDYLNSTPNHFRPSSTTPSVSSISSNNSDKENVPVRNSRTRIRLSFVPEDDAVPGTSSSEISSEKSQNGSARRGSETSRSTPSEISGDDGKLILLIAVKSRIIPSQYIILSTLSASSFLDA